MWYYTDLITSSQTNTRQKLNSINLRIRKMNIYVLNFKSNHVIVLVYSCLLAKYLTNQWTDLNETLRIK